MVCARSPEKECQRRLPGRPRVMVIAGVVVRRIERLPNGWTRLVMQGGGQTYRSARADPVPESVIGERGLYVQWRMPDGSRQAVFTQDLRWALDFVRLYGAQG